MMNGITISVASAITPTSKNPHPPTGVIMSSDEALLVRLPNPLTASEKM